ncbi:hypothetical protein OF122_01985 [Pelagibacterium flavum]|uniref:Uncharacterized protein n=1 Tax=Pelagibacterium flavum TaxID=2984530 RepID=A0ABY6IPQ0_9HYPH|nr:hypothetical protein [Pelagibacterium sp. YIM 151497]UYQ72583.1 hypothetical protein OF122_01985 [Pelagibacterium sp. YIM 151497]
MKIVKTSADVVMLEEIVDNAQRSGDPLPPMGPCGNYLRNREILEMFEERRIYTSVELCLRHFRLYGAHYRTLEWSAEKCGQNLKFAIEHNIVRATRRKDRPAWHLIDAQLQYECIGSVRRSRAIRLRGAPAHELAANARLWERELRARERRRRREITRILPRIETLIEKIGCRFVFDPGLISIFGSPSAAGFHDRAKMILERIDYMSPQEALDLERELRKGLSALSKLPDVTDEDLDEVSLFEP